MWEGAVSSTQHDSEVHISVRSTAQVMLAMPAARQTWLLIQLDVGAIWQQGVRAPGQPAPST